jgi:hypothetical protein
MEQEELFATVFTIGMFSGVFVIYLAMRQRAHQLEMQHRERMAMIERGQVPLETPRTLISGAPAFGAPVAGMRLITLGIVVIAIGFGFMSIVAIAADQAAVGVGIGSAIVILGASFITGGMLRRGRGGLSSSASSSSFERREP